MGAGGMRREIRPEQMKGFGCHRRRFRCNSGGGEAEEKARKAKFERKQRGKRRRREKTRPDVSPHGPTAVVAEERPKRSRNVNKEINTATMTFFFDRVGLGKSLCL